MVVFGVFLLILFGKKMAHSIYYEEEQSQCDIIHQELMYIILDF